MNIQVYGGMQKGLPLANPAQAGLLVQGMVQQCWGNWINTNQTLDMVIVAGYASASAPGGTGSPEASANIPFNWKAGVPLGTAVANALATSFPNLKANVNIWSGLIQAFDEVGNYQSLTQFAQSVRVRSQAIMGGSYLGVRTAINGNTITVTDGTTQQGGVKQIAFQDLIGQPTWFAPDQIQVTTVMRADINFGNMIQLPPTLTTTQAGSYNSILRNNSVFQETFIVTGIRVGNFRQPQSEAWVTTLQCVANDSASPSSTSKVGNAFPVLIST